MEVLNHDFGYGNNEGKINKYNLQDLNDLKSYIKDTLSITFIGKFENSILSFADNSPAIQINFYI